MQASNTISEKRDRHTGFRRIHGLAAFVGLLTISLGFSPGCETPAAFEAPAQSLALLNGLEKLPADDALVKTILPAALGPERSIFGVLLEDDTQVFVQGDVDETTGEVTIDAVTVLDEDGNLVLKQDFRDEGTMLTFATGDAVDVDVSGQNPRIVLTLNASDPPSQFIGEYDPSTDSVTILGSTLEETPNPNYDNGTARIRITDSSSQLRKIAGQSSLDKTDCDKVGNGIVTVIGRVCQLKSLLTGELPARAANTLCQLALESVNLARSQSSPGSTGDRVFSGLRVAVGVACEGLKAGLDVANIFTNANPIGVACFTLRTFNDGSRTLTGETLAEQLCKILSGDQNLGGILTGATAIQLSLLDTGVDDGDEIAIRRNGEVIFTGAVSTTAFAVDVGLVSGLNHFEFEALNEGTLPPNTAQVTVLGLDGADLGNNVFDLSTGQVATMDIIRSS
ncbi:MAG: hypothetical protein MI923_01620 [Phycisphaerales bacterium]|nr:hypothetical protein [Phycisphaerales bacterium]